ncbi:hypothetical protein KXW39_005897, partial [Aspergillus fumigatus]
MSFQLYDGATTVNTDTSPLALNEATRILCNCSEDHHPPPTCKEEVLWRGACGQSMSELLAKAIYNGEALLYKEARLRPDI